MENKPLEEISKKLNVLISLSMKQLFQDKELEPRPGRKGIGEMARYLDKMGIDSKDIAEIVGAPLPSVRTLLTPKRKK